MKTFCKLPLNIKDLLSEDVKHSRLQTCSEKESIDQFLKSADKYLPWRT